MPGSTAGGIGEPGEGFFDAVDFGGGAGGDAIAAAGPEGEAVGVDEPPAFAVVLGAEKAGGILRGGGISAAEFGEIFWPLRGWSIG